MRYYIAVKSLAMVLFLPVPQSVHQCFLSVAQLECVSIPL